MNLLQEPNFKPVAIEGRRPQLTAKLVMPSVAVTYKHQLVFDYDRKRIDVYCGYDDEVTYIFKGKLSFNALFRAAAVGESVDCALATLSLHDPRYRVEAEDLHRLARVALYVMTGGRRVAYNLKDGALTDREVLL